MDGPTVRHYAAIVIGPLARAFPLESVHTVVILRSVLGWNTIVPGNAHLVCVHMRYDAVALHTLCLKNGQ